MANQGRLVGVRETLAELNQVDKKLRRQVTSDVKRAAQPLVSAVRSRLPGSPPMSGWTRGRYPYDAGGASGGVSIKFGSSRSKSKNEWPLMAVQQRNAAGIIFDMAGRRSSGNGRRGQQFIANLNRFGRASRSMWPAVEQNEGKVRAEVEKAIDEAAAQINRKIDRW